MRTKNYNGKASIMFWGELALAVVVILAFGFGFGYWAGQARAADAPVQTKVVEVPVYVTVEPEPTPTPAAEPTPEAAPEPVSLGEFKITHYCPCRKCCGKDPSHPAYGITATGTVATEGRTIGVDPDVIPFGTEVLVVYEDGTEAVYVAEDCGSGVDGNHIDVFMNDHQAAKIEGIKTAEVCIVKE